MISGCSTDKTAVGNDEEAEVSQEVEANAEEKVEKDIPIEEETEVIDLQAIKPNEAGEIMVLMYHHIGEPEAEWFRTPDNFRKDLQELYDKGYRPISLEDYTTGNIHTEAGYTPVVLTFDDGNQDNFNMIQDEKGDWIIDPDSAVGILVDFHEKYPDFPLEATFFINGGTPFGQADWVEYKLNYLVEMGMDIGNHTNTHINFSKASAEKIQEELGKVNNLVKKYLPQYQVKTLALPFGSKPKDPSLYTYLIEGEHEGESYQHIAILEVGWDPYKSPYNKDFDFTKIRRVRASETKVDGVGIYDWMRTFDNGGRLRYISDGDPNIITVPEGFQDKLVSEVKGKTIRTYSLE